ncbi:MAG TPA: aspartyl protease family protein [Candidatus Acidoferrum sp.]|nr:aspartyl protease family protein [Candidatus Acidoferrum sp.]
MRFAACLLALPAAALLAAAPPRDELATIAAASGHPAKVHIRASATRVIEGRTVELSVDQFGPARLVRRCVSGTCAGTWFDGRRIWSFGINEIPLPEQDDAAMPLRRTAAAIASYAFAEPAFRAAGGTVTALGGGRFRVRAPAGAELVALVDETSHAVRRIETNAGEIVATYGHIVRIDGALYALDRRGGFETGPLDRAAAARGPLAAPGGPAVTFAGKPSLALGDDPIPIVPCRLGQRDGRCLFDTGTEPSAIALPFAEALGLEPRGELEIAGFGRFLTGMVESGPLEIGAARFDRVRLAVLPSANAARFDIIVGADLLGRVRLVLDRRGGTAEVGAPAPGAAPDAIALAFLGGRPHVATTIGDAPVVALFDTGDEATVSLGYAAYREGTQWPVAGRGIARGVGGADDILRVTVPQVHVGALQLGETEAVVRRTQGEAHVGIGLWTRCRVELDESNGRLACGAR